MMKQLFKMWFFAAEPKFKLWSRCGRSDNGYGFAASWERGQHNCWGFARLLFIFVAFFSYSSSFWNAEQVMNSYPLFYFSCTDYMYGSLQLSRTDALAIAIERGRDFGLASYNQVREALNLPPVKTWQEINPNLNKTNPEVYTVDYVGISAVMH